MIRPKTKDFWVVTLFEVLLWRFLILDNIPIKCHWLLLYGKNVDSNCQYFFHKFYRSFWKNDMKNYCTSRPNIYQKCRYCRKWKKKCFKISNFTSKIKIWYSYPFLPNFDRSVIFRDQYSARLCQFWFFSIIEILFIKLWIVKKS